MEDIEQIKVSAMMNCVDSEDCCQYKDSSIEITQSCGNVFKDLGLQDADKLKLEHEAKFYRDYCDKLERMLCSVVNFLECFEKKSDSHTLDFAITEMFTHVNGLKKWWEEHKERDKNNGAQ